MFLDEKVYFLTKKCPLYMVWAKKKDEKSGHFNIFYTFAQ